MDQQLAIEGELVDAFFVFEVGPAPALGELVFGAGFFRHLEKQEVIQVPGEGLSRQAEGEGHLRYYLQKWEA